MTSPVSFKHLYPLKIKMNGISNYLGYKLRYILYDHLLTFASILSLKLLRLSCNRISLESKINGLFLF
ncbi:hypothetical protein CYOC110262_15745 [Cytobacillus oceanisediminis]|uniref:Uncharacterized protein n=1 Tax=Cytobacillus oceanisediminis TaxID=665099 RepID=A0A562K6D0_9BACI|nr:hypothetical protein IQ19_00263 [Cytobacillus oceanisediminis]